VNVTAVGREGTMDMMNGESAMSSVREKKQKGEKNSEKRNFALSRHIESKECGSTKSAGRERQRDRLSLWSKRRGRGK